MTRMLSPLPPILRRGAGATSRVGADADLSVVDPEMRWAILREHQEAS
jgi:dihydroorotase-like cyclic amidohydrolase